MLGLVLAGCGDSTWDGSGASACPALPSDVVRDVAKELVAAADAEGPAGGPAEYGALPPLQQTGVLYRCRWSAAGLDDGWGVSVTLDSAGEGDLEEAERMATQVDRGSALAGPVQGQGRAFLQVDHGHALWWCDFRVLDVEIESPNGDPVAGAKKLAEALLPTTGCKPSS